MVTNIRIVAEYYIFSSFPLRQQYTCLFVWSFVKVLKWLETYIAGICFCGNISFILVTWVPFVNDLVKRQPYQANKMDAYDYDNKEKMNKA